MKMGRNTRNKRKPTEDGRASLPPPAKRPRGRPKRNPLQASENNARVFAAENIDDLIVESGVSSQPQLIQPAVALYEPSSQPVSSNSNNGSSQSQPVVSQSSTSSRQPSVARPPPSPCQPVVARPSARSHQPEVLRKMYGEKLLNEDIDLRDAFSTDNIGKILVRQLENPTLTLGRVIKSQVVSVAINILADGCNQDLHLKCFKRFVLKNVAKSIITTWPRLADTIDLDDNADLKFRSIYYIEPATGFECGILLDRYKYVQKKLNKKLKESLKPTAVPNESDFSENE